MPQDAPSAKRYHAPNWKLDILQPAFQCEFGGLRSEKETTDMSSNTSKHIIVHKPNAEGMFLIDRRTGAVATPSNELPDWADGYAQAALASRTGWYSKRLGTNLPESLRSPHAIAVTDLDWIAVDEAGDMVEIGADAEYRTQMVGQLLDLDLSAEGFDKLLETHMHGALVDFTYQDAPNDEATLAEAAAQDFGAVSTAEDRATGTHQG